MSELYAKDCCRKARALWLEASSEADLKQVEALYRTALRAKASPQVVQRNAEQDSDCVSRGSSETGKGMDSTLLDESFTKNKHVDGKKRKCTNREENSLFAKRFVAMALSKKDYRDAANKLALLLCQQGRQQETVKGLKELGYKCRLSNEVLNYKIITKNEDRVALPKADTKKKTFGGTNGTKSRQASVIVDDFLSRSQHSHLFDIFGDIRSSYWTDHNYSVEPPSPYFSYAFRIERRRNNSVNSARTQKRNKSSNDHIESNNHGFLGDLVDQILHMPMLLQAFPQLREAKFVEMWAHNRPHASGHQMHFDSDNEGQDGVRNPIISTILYLSDNEKANSCPGGPSLVTNQPFMSDERNMQLATHGWMAYPRPRRLVAFDGTLLHGVVPGKGIAPLPSKKRRRVTLMLAFWKKLQIRQPSKPMSTIETPVLVGGAARPFPNNGHNQKSHMWLKQLRISDRSIKAQKYDMMREARPLPISCIYETIDSAVTTCSNSNGERSTKQDIENMISLTPWDSDTMGIPEYDEVFQGF